MRLRGLGHGGLEVEARGARVLVDPWWRGAAFAGTWLPPGGGPSVRPGRIAAVFVTRLREDRLSPATLAMLPRNVPVLVPEFVDLPPPAVLQKQLDRPVRVLEHGRPYPLARRLWVRPWVNGQAAALHFDDDAESVLVAASALDDAPALLADRLLQAARAVRGRLDAVFVDEGPVDPTMVARESGARLVVRLPVHPEPLPPTGDDGFPVLANGDALDSGEWVRGARRPTRAVARGGLPPVRCDEARLRELALLLEARARAMRGGRGRPFAVELRLLDRPEIAFHAERQADGRVSAGLGPGLPEATRVDLPAGVLEALLNRREGADLVRAARLASVRSDPSAGTAVEAFLAFAAPPDTLRPLVTRAASMARQALPLGFALLKRWGLLAPPPPYRPPAPVPDARRRAA